MGAVRNYKRAKGAIGIFRNGNGLMSGDFKWLLFDGDYLASGTLGTITNLRIKVEHYGYCD